ncbi:MAG: CAP domain-containing protein [Myxococcota bacterium]|nr:CAP domain-containing protein [Myxococcota bacterium]
MPRSFFQANCFLIGLLMGMLFLWPAAAKSEPAELARLEAALHDEVNAFRRDQQLIPLSRRSDLDGVARAHSEDMIARGYFAHVSPDGANPVDRIQAAGIEGFSLAAENAGQTSERPVVEAILQGWIHSPDHLRNLRARPFNQTGIGMARAPDGRIFVTQLYVTVPRD